MARVPADAVASAPPRAVRPAPPPKVASSAPRTQGDHLMAAKAARAEAKAARNARAAAAAETPDGASSGTSWSDRPCTRARTAAFNVATSLTTAAALSDVPVEAATERSHAASRSERRPRSKRPCWGAADTGSSLPTAAGRASALASEAAGAQSATGVGGRRPASPRTSYTAVELARAGGPQNLPPYTSDRLLMYLPEEEVEV